MKKELQRLEDGSEAELQMISLRTTLKKYQNEKCLTTHVSLFK